MLMKKLNAHEKFIRERRTPLRKYEERQAQSARLDKKRSSVPPTDGEKLMHEIEVTFDRLFGNTGASEEVQN